MKYHGPFEPIFEKGDLEVPGYLELLGLRQDSVQVVLDQIEAALARAEAEDWVQVLFEGPDWRPHLVGAVALLLDDTRCLGVAGLWSAIEAGSWVTPQLVATAHLVDVDFPDRMRAILEQGARVNPPKHKFLPWVARHVAMGPGGAESRSSKLAASLIAAGERLPTLEDWLTKTKARPDIVSLLKRDFDDAPRILNGWIAQLEYQFEKRGRRLQPEVSGAC